MKVHPFETDFLNFKVKLIKVGSFQISLILLPQVKRIIIIRRRRRRNIIYPPQKKTKNKKETTSLFH
jgi:hypothetical protein